MKARPLIGRKIVRIDQTRCRSTAGVAVYNIDRIVLDDGSVLLFNVAELGADYAVEGVHVQPSRRRAREVS